MHKNEELNIKKFDMEVQLIKQKTRFVAFQTGQDQSTDATEHFGLLPVPRMINQASNELRELLAAPVLLHRTSLPWKNNFYIVNYKKGDIPNLEYLEKTFKWYSYDIELRFVVTAHLQLQYTILYTSVYHFEQLVTDDIAKDNLVLSDNPYALITDREPDVTVTLPWMKEVDALNTAYIHDDGTTPWPQIYLLQLHPLMATANAPPTVSLAIFASLKNVKWDYYGQ
ncbi:hypothetical protein 1 [Hubei picorna-like virus 81]|uniref:Uncharacterized protein n=1 Tax=Hubei picorna-like virus 81 TaxID=1923166 RepID=A0A1L3KKU6_9VIRU|nr:hypothetical protein 1 [Hubei picorna-like virus 81]APG77982.1 hypothetical protein 1 [Hubei picorna-like virus 81]